MLILKDIHPGEKKILATIGNTVLGILYLLVILKHLLFGSKR